MKFIPSSPVVFVLIIIAFFAMGMLAGKMFGKKRAEKFDPDIVDEGEFNTPANMARGPKVLPRVPENVGVEGHDVWYTRFDC